MTFMWVIFAVILLFGFVVFWGAPYVPSKRQDLMQAFDKLYPISDSDFLIDLGSGDGVVMREAASRGAETLGYELNPLFVGITMLLNRHYKKSHVKLANYMMEKFPSETTVVYTFSDTRDIKKIIKKVEQEATRLDKNLALISYAFKAPGHKPVKSYGVHHLYDIAPNTLQSS